MARAALLVALMLSTAPAVAADQQPIPFSDPSQPIALVIRYDDGRVVRRNVGPETRSWTPMFPRVADWVEPKGSLRVEAVQYVGVRTDAGVRITVSVLRGRQHQEETTIATVMLTGATPVSIAALSDVGVKPIEMWVEPGEHITLFAPSVENRTAGLEVTTIEVVDGPPAGLIITVRNVSTRSALSYNFETFEGGRPMLSGRQADPDGQPVVAPGGEHTFRLNFAGSRPVSQVFTVRRGETFEQAKARSDAEHDTGSRWTTPQPALLAITGVQWTDGTSEGDARAAAFHWCSDAAGRVQIRRIVSALRAAATAEPASAWTSLQAAAAELEIVATRPILADVGARLIEPRPLTDWEVSEAIAANLQNVKRRFLSEVTTARLQGLDVGATRGWIEAATARYAARLSRLSER